MQISLLLLLLTFTITSVTADNDLKKVDIRLPVHRPEDSDDRNPENVNDLLATLFEMHHNLLAQINILEDKLKTDLETMEQSEIQHMVAHYTAQKNNIEYSIQQIQSNDGQTSPIARSNAKDSSIETKSIPILVNFFKRNQTPTNEPNNANIAYSLPYQPHYESQPTPTYVYQASPPVAVPSDPHMSTIPVFQQQIPNGQVYSSGDQSPVYYQEQPNQQINQQFVPSHQVMVHPQAQAISEPQHQPQYQIQYQPQPQSQPHIQVQDEQQVIQQFAPTSQELQPQQQVQIQPQFDFEAVFKPSSIPVRRPQVPEYDTQRYQQQGPFGQKEGVFVYYPNGIITDDKDRPSTANRFSQVFDRFGQAISNLGNWQSPTTENNMISVPRSEGLPTKHKIKGRGSHSKIFSQLKSKKPLDKNSKSNPDDEKKQEK